MKVRGLRCEYHVDPLGIDVRQPRLSWTLSSARRAEKQTAYRILVAGSADLLRADCGDLWDSGVVESDRTAHVVYAGAPLGSRTRCCWKVRAWDADGRASAWSEPARWTMGLLEPHDWQACWIGYDAEPGAEWKAPVERVDLAGCRWVWHPGEPAANGGAETCFFRRGFTLPPKARIRRARIRLSANDRFEVFANGTCAGTSRTSELSPNWHGPVYNLELTGLVRAGANVVAIAVTNRGGKQGPPGLLGRAMVEFDSGEPAVVTIDGRWKTSRQPGETWREPEYDDAGWQNAREIAALGDPPWGAVDRDELDLRPSPFLRREFSVAKDLRRATVYVTAQGLYELRLNGRRVGQDCFTPGWTDYQKRITCQTYDVTGLVRTGNNAVGAILADGWYAGYVGWKRGRSYYGDRPRLKAQLELEYADGRRDVVATGGDWKYRFGPILEADLLMGETYDARLELPGWDRCGFDDARWMGVKVREEVSALLQGHPGVPVRRTGEIEAVAVRRLAPGRYVVDLGQNIGGWARLKVKGRRGDRVVMRFAELLRPDGTIHAENLRGARCEDTYVLRGGAREAWEPHFTFRGFRYVEVSGYPGRLRRGALTGIVAHSAAPAAGSFECSSSMINKLYRNILWTRRANLVEVPTDCPQRNERHGWTGDAGINVRTMTCDMDVAAFLTKWLVDVDDAQRADGAYTDNAPNPCDPRAGTSGWGDGAVICVWTIHRAYGDTRIVERLYPGMTRWIDYLARHSEGLLRPAEGYGDWIALADTPKDVLGTAYFARSALLVSRMAEAIGRNEDARTYADLFQRIADAFDRAYVSHDGKIKGDTQTGYVLALQFGLLPEEKRAAAAGHLVADIERRGWYLSTGIHGTGLLLPTLSDIGRTDVAYRLLNNDTFPSWGHMIRHGATTIWECWDSWTAEKGYQDHSFNQPALGAVGRWLYATCAGIDTDGPGFTRLVIRPEPGGGLRFARAGYDSIRGRIGSEWRVRGSRFELRLTIPANTTATVFVPASSERDVTEGGRPVARSKGVNVLAAERGSVVCEVGSGSYRFVSRGGT